MDCGDMKVWLASAFKSQYLPTQPMTNALHSIVTGILRVRMYTLLGLALLVLGAQPSAAQVGDQSLTTIASWNAYVHLPNDYLDSPSKYYPVIVFIAGVGEIGTDPSKMLIYGPGKYIAEGHDMVFNVNGKLEKPIVISLQPPTGWPQPATINTRIDSILSRWRVDPGRLYLTGLSMGAWTFDNYICGSPTYARRPAAIVSMSAPDPDNPLSNLKYYALNGGKWWGFEGTLDYRKMDITRDSLNAAVPGSARYTKYEGGHCCWNTWYNPAWLENGESIYTWMLKQRINLSINTPGNIPPIANAGADTLIVLPTNSVILRGSGADEDGNIVGYNWKKIDGPSTFTLTNAASATATASNLVAGAYQFELTVTDNNSAKTADTIKVIVNPAGNYSDCGCDRILRPQSDGGIYVKLQTANVQPGERICILAGVYPYISIEGVTGTAERPVEIINCGGVVQITPVQKADGTFSGGSYGFRVVKSRYFRLSGTGMPGLTYGIKIDGSTKVIANGVAISDSSGNFSVDHIEVTKTQAGFIIKTNPANCAPGTWGPNWTMTNLDLYSNYIHNVEGEGFYIGNTNYTSTVTDCSGVSIVVPVQVIHNVKIHDNITDSTGWDGIQVASAPVGVEVYNNKVLNYGRTNLSSQQAGILMGGRTNGRVYNNIVKDGTGNGIQVFGLGVNYIYNNLLINTGTSAQDGIIVDDRPFAGDLGLSVKIVNNTIVKTGRDGIRVNNVNKTMTPGSQFVNNLVVAPGSIGNNPKPYINYPTSLGATESNNINLATISSANFANTAANDYHLTSLSPAVNAGTAISSFGFTNDLDNNARPSGGAIDVGAYEMLQNNTLPPRDNTTEQDYSTLKNMIPVNGTGWNTIYDSEQKPVFDILKNGQAFTGISFSRRIVTKEIRKYQAYFGNPDKEWGGCFLRNWLIDLRGQQLTGNMKLRFIVTAAEIDEFVQAYNLANATTCSISDIRVLQYTGANADLDYANNQAQASLYKSIVPVITSYGPGNSLRYIEVDANAGGEFWLVLTCAPPRTGVGQNAGASTIFSEVDETVASLKAWYRADNVGTATAHGTKVNRLYDLTGNNNDATQQSSTYQPEQVTSKVLNQQPALQFNGQFLDAVSLNINPAAMPYLTVYAVGTHRTGAMYSKMWGNDSGSFTRGAGLHINNNTATTKLGYLSGGKVKELVPLVAYQPLLLKTQYSPNNIQSSINGVAQPVDTALTHVNGKTTFTIGNINSLHSAPAYYQFWDGQIAELLVFNSLLSEAQQLVIENYLAARYNLALPPARNLYSMDDSANGDFDHDVVGIGMAADNSAVFGSKGMGALQIQNPSNLQANEWLFWGHNNGVLNSVGVTDIPAGIVSRLSRIWRASENGEVGTVDIVMSLDSIPGPVQAENLRLLIDTNGDGLFSDESVATGGIASVGQGLDSNTVVFRQVNINNGQRFTVASVSYASPLRNAYVFTGSGNFSDVLNWKAGIHPSSFMADYSEIIIDPTNNLPCILDIPFLLKTGMKLVVAPGKKLQLTSVMQETEQ